MTGYQLLILLVLILLVLILFVATALYLFWPATGRRKPSDSEPDPRSTGPVDRDDAKYWLGGLIYHNPDDPDAFVPKRFGFGRTVTVGHPTGKLLMIAILILPVLPVLLAVVGVHLPSYGCRPSGCHGLP